MSNDLPQIDPASITEREKLKLEAEVTEYKKRETHLELLAEALREQRNTLREELASAKAELSALRASNPVEGVEVPDITTLDPK